MALALHPLYTTRHTSKERRLEELRRMREEAGSFRAITAERMCFWWPAMRPEHAEALAAPAGEMR